MIYLDNHATTPVHKEVLERMIPFFSEHFGNAHSNDHAFGWYAEAAVQEARAQVAGLINAKKGEIIFTSGATESNNVALMGMAQNRPDEKNHIITTSIEHKCILEITQHLSAKGLSVTYLPVDGFGQINIEDLKAAIRKETFLVSVMHANNEVGVVHNLEEIGKICKSEGLFFHTDAAQSLGKVSVDVDQCNIDLLSGSGHKIYGPKGTGFLYCRDSSRLSPMMFGGGQESGLRPGTLNVAGIAGLGKACEMAHVDFERNVAHYLELRDRLYTGFKNDFACFELNGPSPAAGATDPGYSNRLPNNLHCSFVGHASKDIIRGLRNIAVSSGSACSSRSFEPSHVLKAMGVADNRISSSIRIGLGLQNSRDQVELLLSNLKKIIN